MQWEYYRLSTVESCLDEALQELGLEGWELVAMLPESRLFHGYQCLMKRPLSEKDVAHGKPSPVQHRFNKYLKVR